MIMLTRSRDGSDSVKVVDFGLAKAVFFFSSRRRHTRFDCDWSSDVCSSDLILTRSTTPLKFSSAPIGITTGTGLAFRRSFIWSTTLKKLRLKAKIGRAHV